tara:strand:- start:6550 stop:7335 length:786 start_codon:yes stop_codon:yes gene_type:complete
MKKTKFIFKWTFVLSILLVWTFLVVNSLALGSAEGFFSKDFNIPIYVQTDAGTEKASFVDIIEMLFNNDFQLLEKREIIPMDRCSLRGEGGTLTVGEHVFNNPRANFQINYLANGRGFITAQQNRKRFSTSFKSQDIIETNSDRLRFSATGSGYYNRQPILFEDIEVHFDRIANKVHVSGTGNMPFELNNADPTFIEGCQIEEKEFLLFIPNGQLSSRRSIEDVRSLLRQHPELIDAHENLRSLFTDYWWLGITGGAILVS